MTTIPKSWVTIKLPETSTLGSSGLNLTLRCTIFERLPYHIFHKGCYCCTPSLGLLSYLYISTKYQTWACYTHLCFYLTLQKQYSTARPTSLLRISSELRAWNCYCQIPFGGLASKEVKHFQMYDLYQVSDQMDEVKAWKQSSASISDRFLLKVFVQSTVRACKKASMQII